MSQATAKGEPILSVKKLCKQFVTKTNFFGRPTQVAKVLKNVSFDLYKGETLGLVGESGCGKSTTGRTVMGLYKPTSGDVYMKGQKLNLANGPDTRIQMIFQDPYACLNPRMTVGEIIAEPMEIHHTFKTKAEIQKRVYELLELVGLSREQANRFPHEFSGGQRQRVGIARALAINPDIIICDEPISALDVSIQAQVVNLLSKLQKELGLTYIFIAHDLAMVRYISDRVAVMYLGQIVELAETEELYRNPLHPYTQALLSAIPVPDPDDQPDRKKLKGELNPNQVGKGCPFAERCPRAAEKCSKELPVLSCMGNGEHEVACHFANAK